MKIRVGFVSNSSSSSFVCDICGEEYSGMDVSLSDAEMVSCGPHTFCKSHLSRPLPIGADFKTKAEAEVFIRKLTPYNLDRYMKELSEIDDDELQDFMDNFINDTDFDSELPEEDCPLCQFDDMIGDDMAAFLLHTSHQTKEDILKLVKKDFKSYKDFQEFIKIKN